MNLPSSHFGTPTGISPDMGCLGLDEHGSEVVVVAGTDTGLVCPSCSKQESSNTVVVHPFIDRLLQLPNKWWIVLCFQPSTVPVHSVLCQLLIPPPIPVPMPMPTSCECQQRQCECECQCQSQSKANANANAKANEFALLWGVGQMPALLTLSPFHFARSFFPCPQFQILRNFITHHSTAHNRNTIDH